jgi:hypothetical protein
MRDEVSAASSKCCESRAILTGQHLYTNTSPEMRDSLHRTRLRSLAELISAQGAAVPTEWTFVTDLDAFCRGLERKGDGRERGETAG